MKVVGQTVQPWECPQTDGRTDGQTDRRYQVHYLPRFAVDNNPIYGRGKEYSLLANTSKWRGNLLLTVINAFPSLLFGRWGGKLIDMTCLGDEHLYIWAAWCKKVPNVLPTFFLKVVHTHTSFGMMTQDIRDLFVKRSPNMIMASKIEARMLNFATKWAYEWLLVGYQISWITDMLDQRFKRHVKPKSNSQHGTSDIIQGQ